MQSDYTSTQVKVVPMKPGTNESIVTDAIKDIATEKLDETDMSDANGSIQVIQTVKFTGQAPSTDVYLNQDEEEKDIDKEDYDLSNNGTEIETLPVPSKSPNRLTVESIGQAEQEQNGYIECDISHLETTNMDVQINILDAVAVDHE